MAQKRELIEPQKGDKRYVCRDAEGQFTEVGRCWAVVRHG
jgi:hypothetical protein